MLLRSLTLNNVGVYRGRQQICFSTETQRPVTLIGGHNGAGKTTLLHAIPLALYGIRARWVLGGASYRDHLNSLIHHGARTASIVLEFDRVEAGREARYIVERSWYRTRHRKPVDRLVVSVDGKPRRDLAAAWPEFAEGIMPAAVAELAIFDSDKIESLADPDSSAEALRTSIHGLLGLGLIDRLQTDLSSFRRRTARTRSSHQPELLAQNLALAETELAEAEQDAGSASDALVAAEIARTESENRLIEASDTLARVGGELYAQRDDLHRCLAEENAAAGTVKRELVQLAASDLPLALVPDLVKQTLAAGEQHEASRLADQTHQQMLTRDDRLSEHIAAALTLDDTQTSLVRDVLRTDLESLELPQPPSFAPALECTDTARSLLHRRFSELRSTTKRLTRQLQNHLDDIDRLHATLAAVPDEANIAAATHAVNAAETDIRCAERTVAAAAEAAAAADRRFATARRRVDALAHETLEADAAETKTTRTAREITAADETLTRFVQHMVNKHLSTITKEINTALAQLLHKQGLVSTVFIDPEDLSVTLRDSKHRNVDARRLSAGERQMMATGILWGLSRCTGMTLPTVIDTPLGRLDRTHRRHLVERYFPNASRQVVLLSTDEEIAGDHLQRLLPNVGAQYLLRFDATEDCTTIHQGYHDA